MPSPAIRTRSGRRRRRLHATARRSARLVEDLLDVSRITLGGVRLDWQPVNFAALVDAAAAGVRPTAEAKGIRLLVTAMRSVPRISGDPDPPAAGRLEPPDQCGQVHARTAARSTSMSAATPHVVLTVTDTGQGIDPSFVPFVFDMFRQARLVAEPRARRPRDRPVDRSPAGRTARRDGRSSQSRNRLRRDVHRHPAVRAERIVRCPAVR